MSQHLRTIETAIAWFSLGALVVYVPGETAGSWGYLSSPGYIVDVIAFVLLLIGGVVSLRARPRSAIGLLCAAWGFCACLGWRSYFMRVISRQRNLGIYVDQHPAVEPILAVAMIIAFIMLFVCLYVAWMQSREQQR